MKGVNSHAEKELNAPERFEKAFKGVPSEIWKTFEDPSELMGDLRKRWRGRRPGPYSGSNGSVYK